jgi:hypothetical protein
MRGLAARKGPLTAAILGLSFTAVALVTRLPFLDRTLFISDSVRYALALERYDMTAGRPHPPGNPLYVGCIALIDHFVGDPVFSLALFSALATGAALLFAYLLGRDLAGETAGWLAAGLLMVSPLFWFFGDVGMPATGEAALSLMAAWLARRARQPVESGAFWALTIVLALAFGFRSTFAVLMAPLWLFAAWRHPWRRIMGGAALGVAAVVGWTALVASLSGGWTAYRQTSASFLSEVVIATKILGGGVGKIPVQATEIGTSSLLALGLFMVPFLVGLVGCLIGRPPFPGAGPFMAAWGLPMALFHITYDWAPRFGVLLLPIAVMLAAASSVPLAQWLITGRRSVAVPDLPPGPVPRALIILALALNMSLFLLPAQLGSWILPQPYPGGMRLLARNHDMARRDAAIHERLEPRATLVLAYGSTFHAAYFLPAYRVAGLFPLFQDTADAWVPSARERVFSFEPGSTALPAMDPLPIPADIHQVLIYDDDYLAHWPTADLPLTEFDYDQGRRMHLAKVPAGGGCLDYAYQGLSFHQAGDPACGPQP